MTCFHPLTGYRARSVNPNGKRNVVFNPALGYRDMPILLPCGQCTGCRIERSRQWAIRCFHEASLHEDNTFATLTYNNENLPNDPDLNQPYTGTLVPRDFQLFMKRLRKEYGAGIRFYACGEYGELNQRPHYHTCLFNFDPGDLTLFKIRDGIRYYTSDNLDQIWKMGFTLSGAVTFQSAAYVARYIMKKINGPMSTQHYEMVDQETGQITNKIPEYTTMSRMPGIGKHWYDKFKTDVFPSDEIIINGKKVRPPRYYDQRYEITDLDNYTRIKRKRIHNAKLHAHDQTSARLKVRETVQNARLKLLPRNLD